MWQIYGHVATCSHFVLFYFRILDTGHNQKHLYVTELVKVLIPNSFKIGFEAPAVLINGWNQNCIVLRWLLFLRCIVSFLKPTFGCQNITNTNTGVMKLIHGLVNYYTNWLIKTQPNIFLPLMFRSLPETFLRRSLFTSSSGSCHDGDATWQEIGHVNVNVNVNQSFLVWLK